MEYSLKLHSLLSPPKTLSPRLSARSEGQTFGGKGPLLVSHFLYRAFRAFIMKHMRDTFPLVRWNAVESALQNAQSIENLNSLRSKIETLYVLSKQSKQSLAMQNKIASYRLRVDRKRGEWLQEHLEWGGDRRRGASFPAVNLKSIGISGKQSHILQRLASLPEDAFRSHIINTLRNGGELTTASILRLELALKFGNRKAPPLPKGKYSVIYAEPPYEYEFANTHIRWHPRFIRP
jgi:hypothetical protein